MKKIAIVSCYFQKNYGSALQAYATQKILDKLNVENVTIRYDGLEPVIKKKKYKYYAKRIFNPEIVLGKLGYVKVRLQKKFLKSSLGKNLRLRDEAIKKFEGHFKLSPRFETFDELSNYVKEFDAVLVGSDQLWLPSNLDVDYYTLNWVPEGVKKISYATSFGVSSLPRNYYKLIKSFISKIDYLSVREESGKEIINDVCETNAKVICDPTLMFTADEWLDIQDKKPIIDEKYIFCYFLGDNRDQREFVKRLATLMGCKIVAILHLNVYVKSDEKYVDYAPYEIDSAGFLNLIRNAEYICTDSFHASIFSILHEKRFFTFRRFKANYSLQTNSRLDSLLDALSLRERLIAPDVDVSIWADKNIDYVTVNSKLNDLRAKNLEFLEHAITSFHKE